MTLAEFDSLVIRIEAQIEAHMAARPTQASLWAGMKAFISGPKVLGAVRLAGILDGSIIVHPQPPEAPTPQLTTSAQGATYPGG